MAVGALGALGVETGVLPGKPGLDRALGLGEVAGPVPSGTVGPVRFERFASTARRRDVTWGLFLPPGVAADGLPLALLLHGRGGSAHAAQDLLHVESFLADHVRRGGAPLAVVSVDGGDRYWHPRRDGDDALAMITGELLPRAGRAGLAVDRIAAFGYSMGGYGALLLARQSEADRLGGLQIAAAAASSPALFASAAASSPGAFDDAADWARWGDLAAHPGVRRTPLSVSCGTSDPFAHQTERYRDHCAHAPDGGLGTGRHDGGYWRSRLPEQLDFLAAHLTKHP